MVTTVALAVVLVFVAVAVHGGSITIVVRGCNISDGSSDGLSEEW